MLGKKENLWLSTVEWGIGTGGGGFGMYTARMPLTTVVVYFSKFEFTLSTPCTKCMLWVVSHRKNMCTPSTQCTKRINLVVVGLLHVHTLTFSTLRLIECLGWSA